MTSSLGQRTGESSESKMSTARVRCDRDRTDGVGKLKELGEAVIHSIDHMMPLVLAASIQK